MSGHSHFATIRRQKEANDAAKGKVFSKMGRAISIAVKEGGGGDPESNFKLRIAIETARAANMPKANIERAIENAAAAENTEQIMYEGFGPGGIQIMAEVSTDNRNRTAQEMKNIFEKGGGSMGGAGSVAFNFEPKGLLFVAPKKSKDEDLLELIDLGAEDAVDASDGTEIYVAPTKLFEEKKKFENAGFSVISAELVQKPRSTMEITDPALREKISKFLEDFDDHDDIHKVYTNAV
ncbi:MAG: YebC/PmpR family DNA-binding transcriptional regulator [Patescibacteria group bacterium]